MRLLGVILVVAIAGGALFALGALAGSALRDSDDADKSRLRWVVELTGMSDGAAADLRRAVQSYEVGESNISRDVDVTSVVSNEEWAVLQGVEVGADRTGTLFLIGRREGDDWDLISPWDAAFCINLNSIPDSLFGDGSKAYFRECE